MSNLTCPACQAGNVMRQRMVFDAGTATTTTTTTGVGGVIGSGGVAPGVFAASSSGQQQSALAKKCAPPEGTPTGCFIWLAVIMLVIGLAATGSDTVRYVFLGISALMVVGAVAAYRENRAKLPALLATYERRWLCMTCGHAWERDLPTAGTSQ